MAVAAPSPFRFGWLVCFIGFPSVCSSVFFFPPVPCMVRIRVFVPAWGVERARSVCAVPASFRRGPVPSGPDDAELDENDQSDHGPEADGVQDEQLVRMVLGRVLRFRCLLGHFGAFARDQEPVVVDAVRRARQQGDEVPARLDGELAEVVRCDDVDVGDLVGEGPARDGDVEYVAFFGLAAEAAQFVEHELVGEARVRGDDRMRVLAADRQAGAVQMARSRGQYAVGRAVADGQVDAEPWIADGRHDSVLGKVELRLVGGVQVGEAFPIAGVVPWVVGLSDDLLLFGREARVVVACPFERLVESLSLFACGLAGLPFVGAGGGRGGVGLDDHEQERRRAAQCAEDQA